VTQVIQVSNYTR